MKVTCFVMGNGPSLRDLEFDDLRGFDTIGMNAAYRYWQTIDWYPTYYACLDLIVGLSHQDEIGRLITHAKEFGIRGFLLRRNLIEALGDIASKPPVINFDDVCLFSRFFRPPDITTGSHSALWAAYMGYRNIYILGVDCDYTSIVEGAVQRDRLELEIEEEKHNPNYFFEGYQRKGDKYSLPELTKDLHLESWRHAKVVLDANHVKVVNLNARSRLDVFPFACFADIISKSDGPRQSQTPLGASKTSTNSNKKSLSPLAKKDRISSTLRLSIHHDVIAGPFTPMDKAQFDGQFFQMELIKALVDKQASHLDISGAPEHLYAVIKDVGIDRKHPFSKEKKTHIEPKTIKISELESILRLRGMTGLGLVHFKSPPSNIKTLQAFPWSEQAPTLVISEWHADNTRDNGQSVHDVAGFLLDKGYVVVVAEWQSASHEHASTFHKLACYPTIIDPASNRCLTIAFRGSLLPERLLKMSLHCLAFGTFYMSVGLRVRRTQNWAHGLWINSIKPPLRTIRDWVRHRLTPARAR